MAAEKNNIPYKIYLSEDEMPKAWYNVRADMKNKPAPLLNPGTGAPMTFDDLRPVFCDELVRQELVSTMDSLLSALNERQQRVLRLHFGMEDGVCHSLEEIGQKLGISKERVRQVERQAMDKLQKMGASLGLEDFLNE